MSDYIPPTVLIKILLELPVKSLVRFTLVSKTWQAFITSEDFIATHLSRVHYDPTYKNRSRDSLITRYYSELDAREHYELRPDDSCFLYESSEIKFQLKSGKGFSQLVGSCNGIICLCGSTYYGNFSTCPIVLWNPSIQKDVVLPLPKIEPSTNCFVLGFGYDVQRDDYKVVRILYRKGFERKPVEAEIFSLRNKRWKTVRDLVLKGYINDIGQSQVNFNGTVHWMAYQEKGNGDLQNSILGFDCSDEEFIETMLPDDLADVKLHPNLHITAHKGCLGMISYNASVCRIWVLKEYGSAELWTQLYFFEWTQLYEVPLGGRMAKVVGFRNTGELLVTLMLQDDENVSHGRPLRPASGELISYNPKTREVSKHPQLRGSIDSFHVLDYVETLSLLDFDNAGLQETDYPIKEELVSHDAFTMGESDIWIFEGEDSKEVRGFGKFKDNKDENNDGDVCMGEVNFDYEGADDIVSMEEFDDIGNNGVDFCMGEVNVDNEAEDDNTLPMEEVDDSWILIPDLKDLQIDPAKKPITKTD